MHCCLCRKDCFVLSSVFCFCLYCIVSTMAFSLKVRCFAKPRSSLDVPKELLIDSVPPSEIVIGGGRACEVSVGHFGGQKVALKKYIGIRGNAEYESVILKEAAAIYKTRHKNVVGIRFVCLKEMTLGLEYCEKVLTDEDGNPHSFNNARQILGFLSVLSSEVSREIAPVLFSSMACQVSEGLRYLHSIKIIHADLKSANVLVTEKRGHDDSWLFKLADFGESRLSLVTSVVTSTTQNQSQQNRGGTICFMSPERCDNKRPTFACDLFSFGIFLYELHDFTIKFPFEKDGFPVDVIVNKIRSGVLPCHEDMSSPLKEVFLKCCAFEPKARPTVFELCKMLTELAPEAFMQPDCALNSTIQFPILNSNNDSYQENFSVSDLPLTDLSQPVSHSEFSSSGLPDSHLLVSEVMVPATEPSQMILDAVAGCALRNFGITQLKDFQIRSITNILKKEDALVVSGTGSGKSICYQIPSVMESGITLLVVPTIALRKDQSDFLLSRGIDSFVVGEKIAPVEYDQQVTAISDLSENKPVILVGTPERFMGREGSLGFVRRQRSLLDRRLKFVVFDECHLLYEWCGFRSSFLELKSLRSFFPRATFLALTATLLPKDEKLIIEEFLHNPCVVRMSVDRPNVRLEISHYSPPSGLEGSVDWVESWSEAAKRIIGTVNGQLAIVYFSYAREVNAACSAISSLGVKAAAFTGECSSLDKNHFHAAMRNGEIEILCATTAYGCGLNLPNVRCVVRFGLPKNMSSWMQEQGRAGRDGKPARAVILLNEKYDINRCVFWLDGSSDGDKKSMLTNFVDVLKYAYSGFSGLCLRKFQVEYFGESLPQGDAQNCCQSCDDQSFQDASGEIRKVVDCLKLFYDRGILSVSETHITSFLMGRSDKWLREHLVDADYTAYPFHSFVGGKGQHVLSGLIRQASSLGIVTIHLREMFFGGRREVRKFFSLGMSLPEVVKLPPVLYSKSAFSVCTSLTPSRKPRQGVVDKVLAALLSGSWKNATLGMLKYPGYTENSGVSEVLFIDDVKTIYDGDDDYVFLMGNMQLTRKGGMPKFEKVVMLPNDESQISVLVRVNECAGVKQCTAAGCEFSLQNCFSRNTCLEHPDKPLKNKCCGCRIVLRGGFC
ncbi:uncharacterized protein LOC136027105 [Artemia franciscana]|uniref:uncharacterized protein LOC136027105 n=1 Tax=Artemia franciscana TaxID=6661 RepID=UPI0032D9D8B0